MTIPEATQRVVEAGRVLGFEVDVHFFPEGTKTSQDAADAIGCQLSAIAKSIVLTLDEAEQVVVFASGDTRIDLELLARAAGATSARRATLDEARFATGFAAGVPDWGCLCRHSAATASRGVVGRRDPDDCVSHPAADPGGPHRSDLGRGNRAAGNRCQ